MPNFHCFGETLCSYTRDASHHFDLLIMAGFYAGEDQVWRIDDPAPGCADGVGAVAPAEDAFVGAGEGGCGFHALVRGDAIERVFVAGASATECRFGPAADLDTRMGADYRVTLLGESGIGGRIFRNHFFGCCGWCGRSFLGVGCKIYFWRFGGIDWYLV